MWRGWADRIGRLLGRVIRSRIAWGVGVFLVVALGIHVWRLDRLVVERFEGKRWSVPARVYARPLELHAGATVSPARLEQEIKRLAWTRSKSLDRPGTWRRSDDTYELYLRPFRFWDGEEPGRRVRVRFDGDRVTAVEVAGDGDSGGTLARLDPVEIGTLHPAHREDRILVRLADVPPGLVRTLIEIEDRNFYEHHGIDWFGILRALLANLRAFGVVQGASTLTQQLAKNFFLTPERSLTRKFNEALIALLMERRYAKDEILEAYLNEIYFAQDGARGIHGVGLASQFLFARDVKGLGLPEAALLVGMIRGPSLYDPRRHPERARERRDKVIDILVERGAIDGPTGDRARRAALGVVPAPPGSGGAHPAFIELVRRQLQREYREEDLTSEGLRIFTTLDASVQEAAEIALSERLAAIERARKIPALKLEGAVIATEPQTGEVLAAVGGRGARYEGFNRVLDAVRPIGSLVKPAVYLAAFSQPERFTLATRLDDGPFSLKLPAGNVWTPHNYDGEHHGEVLAWRALRDSLNIATVRLGLGVGLDRVLGQVHAMGVGADFSPYPSTLLGAGGMSPAEVAQMYQVFAAGGFVTPLRAIREVLSADGQPLTRYPLTVERAADPRAVYLVNAALEAVTRNGTARSLAHTLPGLRVAGKTGTTNDQRDSWFAGFTEDRLVVVWVGRDDNGPTGLTGATGALPVFSDILAKTGARSFDPIAPEGVEELAIEPVSGLRGEGCENTIRMPFYAGSAPREAAPCARGVIEQGVERVRGWVEGLME